MGEIFELKEKLEKEGIPFVMDNWLGGHQIILFNTVGERICDAIINDRSYGITTTSLFVKSAYSI